MKKSQINAQWSLGQGLVAVLASTLLIAGALVVPSGAAVATTPGSPGTPQSPTPLFTEDFSAQNASTGIMVNNYTGASGTVFSPGVSGASSETYYADPAWVDVANCNGVIVNSSSTPPPGMTCGMGPLQLLATSMGNYQGMSSATAPQNQAVTAYTNGPSVAAGIQLRTNNPIPAVAGHFYQVSAIFGATNCGLPGDPRQRFSLIVNGTANVVGQNLNPCTDASRTQYASGPAGPTYVSNLRSSAMKLPTTSAAPTVGIQIENTNTSSWGNDAAFDLPQILDVTPQMDKSFSPSTIASGQRSTLTFTITNTSELAAKTGWSFLDNLPTGLTATGVNATTCSNASVTAAAGATSVQVSNGDLNQGQNSCTVTVQVTATIPGTYTNGPDNFPPGTAGLDGLNPPADATLTVTQPASLNMTKTSTTTALTRVGQVVTYKFTVVNRAQSTLHNITVTDTQQAPATQGNLSSILCQTTTLAPQDSTTCTASYTVTQADLDHGSLTDTATASGLDPNNRAVTTPPATLTITGAAPAISVTKSSTTTLVNQLGQQVPYSFLVTNTGNVTLFGVSVTDTQTSPATQANLSAITCPQPALAPGESETCTATYTATQADLQNGSLNDSATASGAPEDGAAVTSDPSALSIPTQLPGSLTIRKTTTTAAVTAVGQQIPYTFTVTNNSTVTVHNVTVADTVEPPSLQGNLTTPTCQATTLAPGASTTCTATYQVTQADVNQGLVADHAVARGLDPSNNQVVSSPSRVELHSPISAITIVKSTTSTSVSAVGQRVPYSFVLTNTGNQTLSSVSVTDTQVAPSAQANMSAVTCPQTTLNAGASMTCTGTYTVTQTDINNGSINDFATASGTNPAGTQVTSPQSSATVNATTAALTMVKSSSTNRYSQIGQTVRYTFTVTNNSSTTYSNIRIQDTQIAPATQGNLSVISCDQTTLAPSQVATCTATYAVTAADITNGSLNDSATATGVDVSGNTYTTARSSVVIPAVQRPAITVTKTADRTLISAVGQQVAYTFTVRNTGNVAVTNVQVADTQVAPSTQANMTAVTCPTGALQPGATFACTGTYTVTQADLDHGTLTDTATASATDPNGAAVNAARTQLSITANPALSIRKASTTTLITTIGQQVPYTFVVTNIRSSTVSNVRVDDTQQFPATSGNMSAIVCDSTTLAAGASTTCRGTYTVTAADIANGSLNDSAVAQGTDSRGLALPPSEPSTVSIPTQQSPSMTIVKSSNTTVITAVGQSVTYRFLVTNTGNVDINSVDVSDTQVAPATQGNLSAVSCPYMTLTPGQSETCTATYTVTQADITNGSVNDSATASGTTASGTPVLTAPSALSIPAPSTPPAISIVKASSSTGVGSLNEQIPYTFTVTNNSNVTLTNVRVTDTQIAPAVQSNMGAITCPSTTLAAGVSMTCTGRYTTSQPDFDHGRVDDSAVAAGTDPSGTRVQSSPSTLSVPIDPVTPGMSIDKRSATTQVTQVGQQVPYSFVVTNTGNQTLSNVSVTDVVAAPSVQSNLSAVTCPSGSLAPNRSVTCTATYTATEADLNNGRIDDSASARATSPDGASVSTQQDSLSIPTVMQPSVTIVKSSSTSQVTQAGQAIPYSFVVTNTGNVTLASVSVADTVTAPSVQGNLSAVACPDTTLSPNESVTCTATYTTTQADVDNGSVNDSATASGTQPATTANPNPTPTRSTPSAVTIPVVQQPAIGLVKASTAQITRAGQQVPYTFRVTNNGNVSLSAIRVTDTVTAPSTQANLSAVTCPSGSVAPGASVTCTATYTTTQADVDSGSVSDQATAAGTPPATASNANPSPVTSAPSAVTLPVTASPALTVVKSSPQVGTPLTAVGQQITYNFLVTNSGNVTMTNIQIADSQAAPASQANLSAVTCPTGAVAPSAQITCTATYTVTQADIDHGAVSDTATASGLPPATSSNPNPPRTVSPPSTLQIPSAAAPAMSVVKSSTTSQVTTVGQQIPYTFQVTNTGNVTLSGVSVTDTVTAPSTQANLSAVLCPQTSLIPGESVTCTATYTTTQADVDSGTVNDSATAAGTPPATASNPNPGPVTTAPSAVSIPVAQQSTLTVQKATATSQVTQAGQQIPYTFLVTNTGNVTVTGLLISDTVAAPSTQANLSAISCPTTTLGAGEQTTCTATYTVTQADVDAGGPVSDTATASGQPPATSSNPNPPRTTSVGSTVSVPVVSQPSVTVVKSSTTTQVSQVGQVVPYSFTVTNTGNVTLNGVTVNDTVVAPSDPANLSAISCPATTLAPGDTLTCTATYRVTRADVDNGSVADSASVQAIPPVTASNPNPAPVVSTPSDLTIPVNPMPAMTVVKSSTTTQVTQVGQQVPYTFVVTNTGNVTLTAVSVTDTVSAPSTQANLSAVICPQSSLQTDEQMTCTATYTTTQADVDNGSVNDSAAATGTPPATASNPNPTPITSPPSSATIPTDMRPGLTVVKSSTTTSATMVGQQIPYTFRVTNTGNVTLTGVTVNDTVSAPSVQANLSAVTCPTSTLAPGEEMTCTATYTVAQADLVSRSVIDTATSTGRSPNGTAITSEGSAFIIPAVPPANNLPTVSG